MARMKRVKVGTFEIANDLPFTLIAGPCQIESRQLALETAEHLSGITAKLGINFIYKTSFDKANRMSINGKRGVGLAASIPIFKEIKERFGCPVLTDIHNEEQCSIFGDVVDVLQVPALLSRQTDLLVAAGRNAKVINVKKGQFMAPWDMKNVADKIASTGNDNIILTERGTSFGYNRLVNDMRALPIMAETGYPVIFDATHSIQEPGGFGSSSGGQREFVKVMARAAIATQIAGVFLETHPNPDEAASDGPCMVHLDKMENLLKELLEFDRVAKKYSPQY